MTEEERHIIQDMVACHIFFKSDVAKVIDSFKDAYNEECPISYKVKGETKFINGNELDIGTLNVSKIEAFSIKFSDGQEQIFNIMHRKDNRSGFRACAYYPVDADGKLLVYDKTLRITCAGFVPDIPHAFNERGDVARMFIPEKMGYKLRQTSDGKGFLNAVTREAGEIGLDTGKLMVTGHSMGGHNALAIHIEALEGGIESKAMTIDSPNIAYTMKALQKEGVHPNLENTLRRYTVFPLTFIGNLSIDKIAPSKDENYIIGKKINEIKKEIKKNNKYGGLDMHDYCKIALFLYKHENAIVSVAGSNIDNLGKGNSLDI